jgi:type I restriction-modification system DNA methylase subunit
MSNASQQIVNKAWNFAHVLRDDGLWYMAYTKQITFLLFLKMAHEQTLPADNVLFEGGSSETVRRNLLNENKPVKARRPRQLRGLLQAGEPA